MYYNWVALGWPNFLKKTYPTHNSQVEDLFNPNIHRVVIIRLGPGWVGRFSQLMCPPTCQTLVSIMCKDVGTRNFNLDIIQSKHLIVISQCLTDLLLVTA